MFERFKKFTMMEETNSVATDSTCNNALLGVSANHYLKNSMTINKHKNEYVRILIDCMEAIEWAQDKTKPANEVDIPDFMNILTNAKMECERILKKIIEE